MVYSMVSGGKSAETEKRSKTMSIGKEIYALRKQNAMSQEELAARLEVSRQSVSLWETDQTVPSIDNLLRMSEIFDVSMDRLCGKTERGRSPSESASDPSGASGAVTEGVSALSEGASDLREEVAAPNGTSVAAEGMSAAPSEGECASGYSAAETGMVGTCVTLADEKKVVRMLAYAFRPFYVLLLVLFVLFSLALAGLLGDGAGEWAFLPVSGMVFVLVCFIGLEKRRREQKKDLTAEGGYMISYRFFSDRFELESSTKRTFVRYTRDYTEIEKILDREGCLYIFFDHRVCVIDKNNIAGDAAQVLRLFYNGAGKYKSAAGTQRNEHPGISEKKAGAIRMVALALFILSFFTLFAALVLLAVLTAYSPFPEAFSTAVKNTWAFFLFLPVPLASVAIGIYGNGKGLKCTKNIVGGSIMAFLLACYGSFSLLSLPMYSYDYDYLLQVEAAVGIRLPDNGMIETQFYEWEAEAERVDPSEDPFVDMDRSIVKFADDGQKQAFLQEIEQDDLWQASIVSEAVDVYFSLLTQEYDRFLLCEIETGAYDGSPFPGGSEMYYLAYDADRGLLIIFHYLYFR